MSPAAGDPKNAHLMALDGAGERLRLFKADLLDYAGVAAAVAVCEGVFHVASPVPAVNPTSPDVYCKSLQFECDCRFAGRL